MYENPDGFLMADHEKRAVPPVTLPVQERHVVHPPADHDKLAWCRKVIWELTERIGVRSAMMSRFEQEAKPLEDRLRRMLGNADPFGDNRLWEMLMTGKKYNKPPLYGTWAEARSIYREWRSIDDKAAPIAERMEVLKAKRRRYGVMQGELESNIEHWEGV